MILNLNPASDQPLYQQIYYELTRLIRQEQLPVGSALPSQRQMAQSNGISVNTVTNAYEQLVIEGYLEVRPRVGHFVADVQRLIPWQEPSTPPLPPVTQSKIRWDLTRSTPDERLFPYQEWARLYQDLFRQETHEILTTLPLAGLDLLRQALCDYSRQARGVDAQAQQVVIGPSSDYLLDLLLEIIKVQGQSIQTIAVENPGYPFPPSVAQSHQIDLLPTPLGATGIDLAALKALGRPVDLVYFTPNHQFPTGSIMPLSQRQELLTWAMRTGTYLIEDDYDSEFRYAGMPIPSFYHLDQEDHVIYMSSLTRNLAPGLRVSYMILPESLLPALHQVSQGRSSPVHTPLQWALAEFIQSSQFQKHLNRSRRLYKQKREKLIQTLTDLDPEVQIIGEAAGLHLVVQPSLSFDPQGFLDQIEDQSIHLHLVASYMEDPSYQAQQQLFLSFSSIPLEDLAALAETIYTCLEANPAK